jgi:putative ABC transport system permease protein
MIFALFQSVVLRPLLTGMIAFRALRRNTMRSILTALGIIIGVGAVVAMVAVGNGAQAKIESQVAALGQNLLIVFAGNRKSGGVNSGLGTASSLTLEDAAAIAREVLDVVAVSPEINTTAQVIANGRNWSTSVLGESPGYLQIRDWELSAGAMFSDRDVRAASKVAVIGPKTANQLFGPINPVGQTVRVKNIPFIIIALLTSKGAGMGGNDQDDRLIIPFTTAMKRVTGDKTLRSLNVQVASAERMTRAQEAIQNLLRQRHRLPPGK